MDVAFAECDGGLAVHVTASDEIWAISAWRGSADAAVFTCDVSSLHFVRSVASALKACGADAATKAACAHDELRATWWRIHARVGSSEQPCDDESTISVQIIEDDPVAPTGDGGSSGGSGGGIAPIRVGRYHYGARTGAPARTTLHILERDARTPHAELRDVGGLSACAAGELGRAQALADQTDGCGWAARHAVDKFGSNALMWAASYGRVAVARWLVEVIGLPVDARNKAGRTALMFACKYAGQTPDGVLMVDYLLHEAKADVNVRMRDESSAFDWAVFGGEQRTMELMASHPDVDVASMNRFGCAAVQWAAAAGRVDTLRWLQAKGLSLSHVNGARHGAVMKAAWKGHLEALEWLVRAEDGPHLVEQLDILDENGASVAELARQNGMPETAGWLQHRIDERRRGAS